MLGSRQLLRLATLPAFRMTRTSMYPRCFNAYYAMEPTTTATGDNDIASLQNDEDRYATHKDSRMMLIVIL